MPEDLSYLKNLRDEQVEQNLDAEIKKSIEGEILKAIAQYLNEVADTMQANKIECLNEPTVRAMAAELLGRSQIQPEPTGN
jgi:hypothetical protein